MAINSKKTCCFYGSAENAGPENAGPMMSENEEPNRSTGKCGTKMQERKMRDPKM